MPDTIDAAAQRTLSRIDVNNKTKQNNTPSHIIFNFRKTKIKKIVNKSQKVAREDNYRGAKTRMTSDFSSETRQARRERNEIFKVLKDMREGKTESRKERKAST